jgi:uncharacterized protein
VKRFAMPVGVSRKIVAFVAGLLFSAGLSLSGMTRPSKIIGFLDVFGRWDPSLALVMIGAVGVSAVSFRLSARRAAPVLDQRFHVPSGGKLEPRLLIGAALFGVGWGLSGLCPGPAVVAIASGQRGVIVFALAMVAGMALEGVFDKSSESDELALLREPGRQVERPGGSFT